MATFALYPTQNHIIYKLTTNTPKTQKPMWTGFPMSYQASSPSFVVVGQEFLSVLSDRESPYCSIKMLASKRSAAKQLSFQDKTYWVEELTEDRLYGVDIALPRAGEFISKNFGTIAGEKGCIVVDNSSAFRMGESVPLVIPEVNPEAIRGIKAGMGTDALIANRNCSTINCLMAAKPLLRHAKVTCIGASAYQAASGAGAASMEEFELQIREVLERKPPTCTPLSQQSQRGPGDSVAPRAAANSIELVTDPHTDVLVILHRPTDMNPMAHAIYILHQNDIHCQVMKSFTKEQLIKELSRGGRRVIIGTDHGDGRFLDIIASYTPGIVIGVPMRASEVTGAKPAWIGMSPKLPILLVEANNAIGAAKLALTICAFGHPQARILKKM